MWWSDRRGVLLALGAGVLVAGCGFSPAYAPGGAGEALVGTIRANDPGARRDFQLVAAFEERLGRADQPRWAMSYQIGFGGASATLFYEIRPIAGGDVVASGAVSAQSRLSDTDSQFSSIVARDDAELRLMRLLADQLVTRLYTEPGLAG
jgi:LPS-assembly lipoprotein